MAGTLRLILALHNHQPVGNFDGVVEQSYQKSYLPFLDVIADYPDIAFALHTSGSLLEWLEDHHPEYIDCLRALVERGQVEIIGGAFYDPILANIPRRDRIGQIRSFTRYLEAMFSTSVRGMWMPERVWEQSFAGDLSAAGISYTILDDHHFRCGGLTDEQLFGYYLTEDEGRLLAVLPGSERLRYLIPFQDPWQTIDHLRHVAERHDDSVVVFGDDGEKFGSWPDTYKHVYKDGWLHRFLQALRENGDWLKVTTPAEALDHAAPLGTFYLPDASYREMTEWVLESETQQQVQRLIESERDDADRKQLAGFVRGGFWRNFRVKYPESNEMYTRMLEISSRTARLESEPDSICGEAGPGAIDEIRRLLYRAQCNCSYWHGAFGGIYLPHLRNAVYANLIQADTQIELLTRETDEWVDVSTGDYNLDTRQEIRLSNHRLAAYVCPASGGHLYELDLRMCNVNLLATLNRRPEPYHQKVLEHAEQLCHGGKPQNELASIHDLLRFKEPDLDRKIAYDRWPRKSLVDHFLQPGLSGEAFRRCEGVLSGFSTATYTSVVRRSDDEVVVEMACRGNVTVHEVEVRKTVAISRHSPSELLIQYQLHQLPQDVPLNFAVEFNFSAMPGGASDRYFYGNSGEQLGTLDAVMDLAPADRLGLVDEWQGLDISLEWSQPGGVWSFPIETISRSESGFELLHQSVAVVPHWQLMAPSGRPWTVDLRLTLNTSLARARQLADLAGQRGNQPAEDSPTAAVHES